MAYLWLKAFHIIAVTAWMAGLFYLPRLIARLGAPFAPGALRRILVGGAKTLDAHLERAPTGAEAAAAR
jgi:putative membrane protein